MPLLYAIYPASKHSGAQHRGKILGFRKQHWVAFVAISSRRAREKREQASLDGHSLHTAFTLAFDIRYQQVMVLFSQYPHLVTLRPLYV